nr:MMPL family transporter [Rhabdothermincola salaria]
MLDVLARFARERPGRVLVSLAALTVVLATFAGQATSDTELTAFAPDSESAAALDRVQEDFGAGGATLQVVVDAGPDGDVLTADGIQAAARVEEAIAGSGVELGDQAEPIRSFALPVEATLDAQGIDVQEATDAQIAAAVAVVGDQMAPLLSTDADLEAGRAAAGLVIVSFPSTMTDAEVADASLVLADVVEDAPAVDGIVVEPYNASVFNDALQRQSEEEMPRLLLLSFALIFVILLFQFRSASDVLLGLAGLVITVVWTFGFGVLLGPDYLGVVGAFSQIALIVPVLLVGLGIDYAIHLTSRYREERRHGQVPSMASSMAVRTVGGALVLATLTTVVGFLTNLASPLPPIADFGIFIAVGVLSAFVIMTMLVPAARNLLDTRAVRREAAGGRPARRRAADERPNVLSRLSGRLAAVAERAPKVALAVALVVSLGAVGAATQVETTFSQDDFIPPDSEIGLLLDRIETRFGGELTESTFVVLDGPVATPEALAAMLEVQRDVDGIAGVRVTGGDLAGDSIAGLVATLSADPALAGQFAALGYDAADGVAPDADVAGLYQLVRSLAPSQAPRLLAADDEAAVIVVPTSAGQEGASDLVEAVAQRTGPLAEAGLTSVVTSEPLVNDESFDALQASQTQGMAITLVAALLLLVSYYGLKERKPVLGVITMVPSMAVVSWVLGTMWLLGISFNVLTAMVASIAIGIGVPFGIHVTHRFLEDRRRYDTVDEAIRMTVTHTGGAMAGSALTTAAGFGVLLFGSLVPMQQFGLIVAITILYSFVAAILIQPACLKLWADWRVRKGDVVELDDHERRSETASIGEPTPVGAR